MAEQANKIHSIAGLVAVFFSFPLRIRLTSTQWLMPPWMRSPNISLTHKLDHLDVIIGWLLLGLSCRYHLSQ